LDDQRAVDANGRGSEELRRHEGSRTEKDGRLCAESPPSENGAAKRIGRRATCLGFFTRMIWHARRRFGCFFTTSWRYAH